MTVVADDQTKYLSVPQAADYYPAFSQSAFRHLIFNSKQNGFFKVVRRIGKRKILISTKAFEEWVESQQNLKGGKA
jgi:hypothetical protein